MGKKKGIKTWEVIFECEFYIYPSDFIEAETITLYHSDDDDFIARNKAKERQLHETWNNLAFPMLKKLIQNEMKDQSVDCTWIHEKWIQINLNLSTNAYN